MGKDLDEITKKVLEREDKNAISALKLYREIIEEFQFRASKGLDLSVSKETPNIRITLELEKLLRNEQIECYTSPNPAGCKVYAFIDKKIIEKNKKRLLRK